jgi:hypothetical protein
MRDTPTTKAQPSQVPALSLPRVRVRSRRLLMSASQADEPSPTNAAWSSAELTTAATLLEHIAQTMEYLFKCDLAVHKKDLMRSLEFHGDQDATEIIKKPGTQTGSARLRTAASFFPSQMAPARCQAMAHHRQPHSPRAGRRDLAARLSNSRPKDRPPPPFSTPGPTEARRRRPMDLHGQSPEPSLPGARRSKGRHVHDTSPAFRSPPTTNRPPGSPRLRLVVHKVHSEAALRFHDRCHRGDRAAQEAVRELNRSWSDKTPSWLVPYRGVLYRAVANQPENRSPFFAEGPSLPKAQETTPDTSPRLPRRQAENPLIYKTHMNPPTVGAPSPNQLL